MKKKEIILNDSFSDSSLNYKWTETNTSVLEDNASRIDTENDYLFLRFDTSCNKEGTTDTAYKCTQSKKNGVFILLGEVENLDFSRDQQWEDTDYSYKYTITILVRFPFEFVYVFGFYEFDMRIEKNYVAPFSVVVFCS